jgi:hypothetical protein
MKKKSLAIRGLIAGTVVLFVCPLWAQKPVYRVELTTKLGTTASVPLDNGIVAKTEYPLVNKTVPARQRFS